MAETSSELKLVGGFGSPYSRKMRAVLRYRRIPFRWIMRGSAEDVGIPPVPVALIPVLVFPGLEGAADTAMLDSSPLIRELERRYTARRVIPPDPALSFLDALIEDYADEWMTKQMFHYRWKYPADIHKAGHVLPLDRQLDMSAEQLEKAARFFSERQIGRLGVVGSNEITTPVIEDSYRRILKLLDAHFAIAPFLMGRRPGASDFGVYGQLSQLILFDPTPSAIAAEIAPRVVSWVNRMEDLSWLEVEEGGWLTRERAGESLRGITNEIGRVYAPFLIANATALAAGAETVECEIDGRRWTQKPFPYQGKCLGWLRQGYSALTPRDRSFIDELVRGSGCEALFRTSL